MCAHVTNTKIPKHTHLGDTTYICANARPLLDLTLSNICTNQTKPNQTNSCPNFADFVQFVQINQHLIIVLLPFRLQPKHSLSNDNVVGSMLHRENLIKHRQSSDWRRYLRIGLGMDWIGLGLGLVPLPP